MKVSFVAFCLVMAGACVTQEALFIVQGSCNAARPDGTYALVTSDGAPRVSGAFSQGEKSGPFEFRRSSGEVIAALSYDADELNGTTKLWYGTGSGQMGQIKLESSYKFGTLDGLTRSWYESGERRSEYSYVNGRLAQAEAWDAEGTPLSPQQAEEVARYDRESDRQFFDVLESLVRENQPACR